MYNKILFCIFLSLAIIQDSSGQLLMNMKLRKLDGDSIAMSSFGGRKLLFIVLPSSSGNETLPQLDSFSSRYGDTVKIIGILSYEDGYTSSQKNSVINLYKNLPITLLDGMYTRKSSSNQSSLCQWLTKKDLNRHFDIDITGIGHKFFTDETARLYAVFPGNLSLMHKIIDRAVHAVHRPVPAGGGNQP